jgi:hypothetical protein
MIRLQQRWWHDTSRVEPQPRIVQAYWLHAAELGTVTAPAPKARLRRHSRNSDHSRSSNGGSWLGASTKNRSVFAVVMAMMPSARP